MSKAPQGQVLQRRTSWFSRQKPTPPSLMVAQPLTEEEALAELLAKSIEACDDEHYPIPPSPPQMEQFLMQQRGLRRPDLVPVHTSADLFL